jgi:DNA-binding XRE family transcriptional regulator
MKNLKNLRDKFHYTQGDIAKYLGVSRTTIVTYESDNVKKLPREKEEMLCKLYKISPIALYGPENFLIEPKNADECNYLISVLNQIKDSFKI